MSENGQREFAPRGPVEVGQFLDVKAQELDQLSVLIQQAHESLEEAEERWTEHYDEILSQLEEEHDKLPGEDVRLSLARRRGGWEAWTNFRRAERLVKKLEKAATQKATIISACQSEAKLLREAA